MGGEGPLVRQGPMDLMEQSALRAMMGRPGLPDQ